LKVDNATKLPIIGWREWVELPELGIPRIKAKVDTGARSSSLHASEIEEIERGGVVFVRFKIHPFHRKPDEKVKAEARVLDFREVKSSSGETTNRPVILTNVVLLGQNWPVELTLADRTEMGFRMLLGREAVRGKFLVDGGRSYFGGKPKRKKDKKKDK
jgi:hypothetical protein